MVNGKLEIYLGRRVERHTMLFFQLSKTITRYPEFKIDQDVLRTNFVQDDIATIDVEVRSMRK